MTDGNTPEEPSTLADGNIPHEPPGDEDPPAPLSGGRTMHPPCGDVDSASDSGSARPSPNVLEGTILQLDGASLSLPDVSMQS